MNVSELKMFPHQVTAVEKFKAKRNVLCGDDMGLGKTVIAIELDKERRCTQLDHGQTTWLKGSRKMTLIVAPKSLLSSWADHFADWNPSLKVLVIDSKDRTSFVNAALAGTADVFICNWDVLRLEPNLRKVRWLHKIGDEVQKIKNRKAQVTVAYKHIHALFKMDMSGTWTDNKPDDAWSTLNHLYPSTWGSYWRFFNHHVMFTQETNPKTGQSFKKIVGVHDAETLQQQMAPFYLRRRKVDVLKDLPEKYYSTIRVDLHPLQRRAYDDMRRDMLAWIGRHEDQPLAAPVVISQLVRLQQFAVAYAKLVDTTKYVWEDVNTAWVTANPEAQVKLVGDQFKARFPKEVQALLLDEPSTKLDAVMDILESSSEPLVVFSNSKQAIKLLAARLDKTNIGYGLLTGDTPQAERGELVTNFQAGKFQVFAGTIQAGGVGITLTRASRVVFLDRAWSPAVNKQAEDRLWRIGQKNAVQVIDIIAKDTIDLGRIQQLITKWSWLKQILGDKEVEKTWLGSSV